MKLTHALLPLVAALAMAGCEGNRFKAESVIGQADAALGQVKEQATVTAPDQLKAAETTLAKMKQNFADHEYEVVLADVPKFNEQMQALSAAPAAPPPSEWAT